jgi:hypothetical protein
MKQQIIAAAILVAGATAAHAQSAGHVELQKITPAHFFAGFEKHLLEVEPLAPAAGVTNAPFSADAVTEFTQILGDGNRIERTYTSSMARDSRGRTRREQEVAMLGALAPLQGHRPRLVMISDPATGTSYTLDEQHRTARQSSLIQIKGKLAVLAADPARTVKITGLDSPKVAIIDGPAKVATRSLGTRMVEGVAAEGTQTTMTIAEGEVGNVRPIEVVTERWFSKDLQMEVLITRNDPRSGNTAYRLTNIVRGEPAPDLFTVPPGYTVLNAVKRLQVRHVEKQKLGEALPRK